MCQPLTCTAAPRLSPPHARHPPALRAGCPQLSHSGHAATRSSLPVDCGEHSRGIYAPGWDCWVIECICVSGGIEVPTLPRAVPLGTCTISPTPQHLALSTFLLLQIRWLESAAVCSFGFFSSSFGVSVAGFVAVSDFLFVRGPLITPACVLLRLLSSC